MRPETSARMRHLARLVVEKCKGPCGLDPFTRTAFLVIAGHLEGGREVPSQDVLAAEANMSRREMSNAIAKLKATGLLAIAARGRQAGVYYLGVPVEDWVSELDTHHVHFERSFETHQVHFEAQNDLDARVRAAESSSSFASSPPPASSPSSPTSTSPPPPHPDRDDGVRVLRAFGVDVMGNEDEIDRVLWEGARIEDFRRMCKRSRGIKGREINLAYVLAGVENDLEREGRRLPLNVVPFPRETRAAGAGGEY